jgi:hypothetical protein
VIAELSLGEDLERVRMRRRADRLERVLDHLHERVDACRSRGRPVPPALWQAILGFEEQLAGARAAAGPDAARHRDRVR